MYLGTAKSPCPNLVIPTPNGGGICDTTALEVSQ